VCVGKGPPSPHLKCINVDRHPSRGYSSLFDPWVFFFSHLPIFFFFVWPIIYSGKRSPASVFFPFFFFCSVRHFDLRIHCQTPRVSFFHFFTRVRIPPCGKRWRPQAHFHIFFFFWLLCAFLISPVTCGMMLVFVFRVH